MLLVAYITTMFSADIRFGLNQARLLSSDLSKLAVVSLVVHQEIAPIATLVQSGA